MASVNFPSLLLFGVLDVSFLAKLAHALGMPDTPESWAVAVATLILYFLSQFVQSLISSRRLSKQGDALAQQMHDRMNAHLDALLARTSPPTGGGVNPLSNDVQPTSSPLDAGISTP